MDPSFSIPHEFGTSGRPATYGRFEYKPLDYEQPSIRLVQVLPTVSPEGFIRCRVRHTTVHDTYTCVSYVWGQSDVKTHGILLNESYHEVRPNILEFLHIARTQQQAKWLWIDVLCIDQDNISERNQQVQQMGRIFSNAEDVISWLGQDEIAARFLVNTRRGNYNIGQSDELMAFIRNPYWERAWITQEVALARRVRLQAGKQELDMKHLPIHRIGPGFEPSFDIGILSPDAVREWKGQSLISIISKFLGKKCGVTRDRIYSLLGLCGEGSDLRVDYGISDGEIFAQTMSQCSRLLCFCSVSSVAYALDVRPGCHFDSGSAQNRLFAEVIVKRPVREPKQRLKCSDCSKSLPGNVQNRKSYVLCMRRTCATILSQNSHQLVEVISQSDGKTSFRSYLIEWPEFKWVPCVSSGLSMKRSANGEIFVLCLSLSTMVEFTKALPKRLCHRIKALEDGKTPIDSENPIRLCTHGT